MFNLHMLNICFNRTIMDTIQKCITVVLVCFCANQRSTDCLNHSVPCPRGCQCLTQDRGIITGCMDRHFTHIPHDIATNTWELYLQGNTIRHIETDVFINHPMLRTIVLTDSGIHNLQVGAFNGLENLTSLDLRDNKIKILKSYIFKGLRKLERIILDGNRIRAIESYAFLNAGRQYEGIQLSIQDNPRFREIQPHAFQGAKVIEIHINNASLLNSSLHSFTDLKNSLKMLFLQGNKRPLYFSVDIFSGFKLQSLNLESNGISNVDFLEHVSATDISLSNNPIGNVDFSNYTSLRSVRFLYMANTGFNVILSKYFEGMNKLSELHLAGNNITRIPEKAKSLFSRLQSISLENNKLHCNCELLWFKDWLQKTIIQIRGLDCHSPFRTDIRSADVSMFQCNAPLYVEIERQFENGRVNLICTSRGDPTPKLTWIKPKKETLEFLSHSISQSKISATLQIQSTDKNGPYTCKAENIKGVKTHTVELDVYKTIAMARSEQQNNSCSMHTFTTLKYLHMLFLFLLFLV